MSLIAEATQEVQPTQETAPAAVESQDATPSQEAATGSWFWGEDKAGEGDAPEWLMGDKYKSVAEQAKGYKELLNHYNSKMKGFTGNPEAYELPEVEGLPADHPMIGRLQELGAKYGMNQEMFNELLTGYNDWANGEIEAMMGQKTETIKAEIAKLGENAAQRLKNIADWGAANVKGDGMQEALESMVTNAKQAEVLEQIIAKSKGQKLADSSVTTPANNNTEEKLREMQFATNERGQRLMDVDMDYRDRVNAEWKKYYGS